MGDGLDGAANPGDGGMKRSSVLALGRRITALDDGRWAASIPGQPLVKEVAQ
jgi:hypothetical protein